MASKGSLLLVKTVWSHENYRGGAHQTRTFTLNFSSVRNIEFNGRLEEQVRRAVHRYLRVSAGIQNPGSWYSVNVHEVEVRSTDHIRKVYVGKGKKFKVRVLWTYAGERQEISQPEMTDPPLRDKEAFRRAFIAHSERNLSRRFREYWPEKGAVIRGFDPELVEVIDFRKVTLRRRTNKG
jgi:hypothetical protein